MKSQKSGTINMTQGPILKNLILFSMPLFAGNIFQQLYNTADCMIVGRFLGRDALAAVGSTGQLVFGITGFFSGLATGAQIIISQSFGAKNKSAMRAAIHTALLFSFLLSLILTFTGVFVSNFILRLIHVPDVILSLATEYLQVYFAGISFLILYNTGSAILRAFGDSKRPLYFLIFSSATNIILDILFVLVFKMGIRGAAFATVLSEVISILPVFYVLFTTKEDFKISIRELAINPQALLRILRLGLPGALSSFLIAFSNTFIQKYVNVFSKACIAGWAVFNKFDNFIIMPMISISYAVTTFVSQNYGAGNLKRVQAGVKSAAKLILAVIALLSALSFLFSKSIASLFISDTESIHFASLFIRHVTPFYILCAITMLYCQALHGLGEALIPTAITFGGFVLLRQTYLFIGTRLTSSFSLVALAYPLVWIATSAAITIYYKAKLPEAKKVLSAKTA